MTAIINSEADLLEEAARKLELHGWCRYVLENSNKQLCLIGSIRMAAWNAVDISIYDNYAHAASSHYGSALTALIRYLRPIAGDIANSPGAWNDKECQNVDQAIDVLRKAAKKCREDQL